MKYIFRNWKIFKVNNEIVQDRKGKKYDIIPQKSKPRKIMVTGGCGFIASNFINYWHQKYPDDFILNVDRLDGQ